MGRSKFYSTLSLVLFCGACTAALPPTESKEACAVSLVSAEKAAQDARAAAAEAKIALETAEKLYAEAKLLGDEAKNGTKECSALVSKVEKKQASLRRKRRVAQRRKVTAKPVIEETKGSTPARVPAYPKYSSSDAPPGWKAE